MFGAGAVISWFVRGQGRRISDLEDKQTDLLIDLPTTYATKNDVKDGFKSVNERLDRLGEKMDRVVERNRMVDGGNNA